MIIFHTDEELFYDVDFVICEKCTRGKYARRYKALRLVRRSALRREAAREREKRQRDHEAWVIEERARELAEAREDQAWWEGEEARRMESDGVRDGVAGGKP